MAHQHNIGFLVPSNQSVYFAILSR